MITTVGPVTTYIDNTVVSGERLHVRRVGFLSAAGNVSPKSPLRSVTVPDAPPVTVPDVVGLTQAAATTAITAVGLTVGTVTPAASATVPVGNVISQNPAGGASAALGSAVNLVVSAGAVSVTVPDVVGLAQAAAESAITGAEFGAGGEHSVQRDGAGRQCHQPEPEWRGERWTRLERGPGAARCGAG